MGAGEKLPGQFLGAWGDLGSPTQKGVVTYALSANRQRPLAGIVNAAIFNTWRRTKNQIMYFAPPLIIAYVAMDWAIQKNEYLNSKAGRMATAESVSPEDYDERLGTGGTA